MTNRLKIEDGNLLVLHIPNGKYYKAISIDRREDYCVLDKEDVFTGEYCFIWEIRGCISTGVSISELTKEEKLTLLEYLKLKVENENIK